MRRYRPKNEPNKLYEIQVRKLDAESVLAIVVLDTDHGAVSFAINRGLAEEIRDQMDIFLGGEAEMFS